MQAALRIVPALQAGGRFVCSRLSDLVVLHALQSFQRVAEQPVPACRCICREGAPAPAPQAGARLTVLEAAVLLWTVVLIFILGLALGWRAGRSGHPEAWVASPPAGAGLPPRAAVAPELPALSGPPAAPSELLALEAEATQQLQLIRARHGPGR